VDVGHQAHAWALRWGSDWINLGNAGHINVDSGYGPFPLARDWMGRGRVEPTLDGFAALARRGLKASAPEARHHARMRALAVLPKSSNPAPDDADRVDALARHLRAVGRDAGALAGEWLVAARATATGAAPDAGRAGRRRGASCGAMHGMAPWLFDAGRAASDEAAEAIALLLPWPDGAPDVRRAAPALADWLADWAGGAAQPAARAPSPSRH
jgi:hypothetical protein